MEKSWPRRTMASYTDASPWGWYLPSTSPTQVADFLKGLSLVRPLSYMEYRIRRCTGFNPSRTSGRARPTMTDMAYSMYAFSISCSRLIFTIF